MSLHATKKLFLQTSLSVMLGCTVTANAQLSDQATLSTYQNPWKYLEYLLVVKPQNELSRLTEHSFAAIGGLGAITIGKEYFCDKAKDDKKSKNDTVSKPDPVKYIYLALSALAAGKAAYGLFNCVAKRYIYKNALADFLKKWDTHRPYMPTSFVECFDELALMHQAQGNAMLTSSLVADVFELVQHHIEHHFENRYKKPESKSVDPIESFKNCTEVWANFKK